MSAKRKFIITQEAWYADSLRHVNLDDEIFLGLYHEDGSTEGEFAIRWKLVNGKKSALIKAFDDSWSVLASFGDVIQALSTLKETGVYNVACMLKTLGFEDATQRTSPYTHRAP